MSSLNQKAEIFWNSYLATAKIKDLDNIFVDCSFAGSKEITNELIKLILDGKKTAGSGLVKDFQTAGDPLPKVGNYWIALDSNEEPKCILKTVRIAMNTFKNISDEVVKAEGEGDCTIEYWKRVHRNLYTPFLKEWRIENLDEAEVITEFFEVVFK